MVLRIVLTVVTKELKGQWDIASSDVDVEFDTAVRGKLPWLEQRLLAALMPQSRPFSERAVHLRASERAELCQTAGCLLG